VVDRWNGSRLMGTFQFFDEEFTHAPEFPSFAYTEFCEAMDDGVDSNTFHAQAVAWRLALACVTEDDQQRFRVSCRKNKAATSDWLQVFHSMLEESAERPTQQPTDSSAGLEDAPASSESLPVDSDIPQVQGSMALALVRSVAV
jgi:hypothetical protein